MLNVIEPADRRTWEFAHTVNVSIKLLSSAPLALVNLLGIIRRLGMRGAYEAVLRLANGYGTPLRANAHRIAELIAAAIDPHIVLSEADRLFLEDEEFRSWYLREVDATNLRSLDRKWQLRELLKIVAGVPGDIAECGSYRGASAKLLIEAAADRGCHVHLFDSFEGVSSPSRADGSHWTPGDLTASEQLLQEELRRSADCWTAYRGWIPTRFVEVAGRKFRFVHIDVDLYEPTLASLQFFGPRMETGGLILLDDHGFATCPGARLAAQEYAAAEGGLIVELATGQAILLMSPTNGFLRPT